jgi:hypothetical protein
VPVPASKATPVWRSAVPHDLPGLARFWTQALGWKVLSERDNEIVIGTNENAALGMCFMPVRPGSGRNSLLSDGAIMRYQGGAEMADMLIRDIPDEVIAGLDAHAGRLGLSRSEYG